MTGADAIVKCLEQEGVEYVFGYPGVAIAPFYNSILATDIKTVLVRQEQNAAHAASGYTRISGKPGVVAVTSGPGAENLFTGIATAFADSIPMICITGQVDSHLMGSDVFQEADVSGAVESFVKYSYIVRDVTDIPRIFREAFYIASTGRKGPVLIDIPCDVQKETISRFVYPKEVHLRTYKPTVEGHIVQIRKVIKELEKAKRPIICVGGGVHLGGAKEEVRAFSKKHGIPVVCTMMGLSVMPTDDPLFFGMVGNNGQPYGNQAMNKADLIIMAGARVADRSISQPDLAMAGKTLVHIDVDPAEIGKNTTPAIPLVGDIAHIFHTFNEQELHVDYSDWIAQLDDCRMHGQQKKAEKLRRAAENPDRHSVDPALFVHTLSSAMAPDAVYVADVGQNQLWSCANAQIREGGRFLTSGGMGTMGYALPAALGAALGAPGRQVVCVCGDGGFQMSMMELAAMQYYHIPCKCVVLRNLSLGLVRQHQHLVYHDHFSVIDLGGYPKLKELTAAYDTHYYRLETNAGIQGTIDAFLKDPAPSLMEVIVDPDELA